MLNPKLKPAPNPKQKPKLVAKALMVPACDTEVAGTVTAGLDILLREHSRLRLQLSAAGLSASERIRLQGRQSEIESCYRERLKALPESLAGSTPVKT